MQSYDMNGGLRGPVALSHFFLRERVKPGDRVADATCGNGHDTLLLARLVGPAGRVWAFDVQEAALAGTRTLLGEAGCLEQVEMVAAGHERLAEFIREPLHAVIFNLGYLPGGDKGVITRPATTIPALAATLDLLAPGGFILAVVYTGHPGAREEEEAVTSWAAGLDPHPHNVWTCRQPNRSAAAPFLVLAEKG